jgi:aspartyl-tRNA synthetase
MRANEYRDRWCGELRPADAGAAPRVAGWVHRRRDHGGLVFIDLRDRTGLLQLVFNPETAPQAHAAAHALRPEHVLSAQGQLVERAPDKVNPDLATGGVELMVTSMDHLAIADTPPFPVDEDTPVDELIRMRHRVVDLRRERQRDTIMLRSTITQAMRRELGEQGFVEIETPMLTRSTPEGARDFLVPSRVHPGSFFALPQSPQLFKQLLMIAGFERYFQIVRCFRDEDPRADRQPEFTQLDMELSFVTGEDVIATTEAVMSKVFEAAEFEGVPAPPWPRMCFDEAIGRFGVDRPDTRFGLEIRDVGAEVSGSEFKVFESVLAGGGVVRAINAGPRELSRAEQDGLNDVVRRFGAKAVAPIYVGGEAGWQGNLAKFFRPEQIAAVNAKLDGATDGDLLLFVADSETVAARALGALRLEFADRYDLIPAGRHDPVWIVDFPMFEHSDGRWDPLHHPFTAPSPAHGEDTLDFEKPGEWRSQGYDLVLDGFEIGGGSVRIHDPELQLRVLGLIGMDEEEARARFGFLLDALRYGAPPHAGIAFGLDRIVAMLAGWRNVKEVNIREAITFPKTATGADPLTGAPAPVDAEQLAELHLRSTAPPPPGD